MSTEFRLDLRSESSSSCCSRNCCYPASPTRMVPMGSQTIIRDTTNIFFSCVRECFCCCTKPGTTAQNKKTAFIYGRYLEQEFEPVAAKLSTRLMRIDLAERQKTGAPTYDIEILEIQEKAKLLKRHLDQLNKMIKHVAFYNESLKAAKPSENKQEDPGKITQETTGSEQEKPGEITRESTEPPALVRISVKKRNTRPLESFDLNEFTADLVAIPLERALSQQEIENILFEVTQYLIKRQTKHVASDLIRRLVSKAIQNQGIAIPRPTFLDQISSKELAGTLSQRKSVEELTARECEELLKMCVEPKIRR